jgi:hypothetical protein
MRRFDYVGGKMAWYLKHYECTVCGAKWTDEWSCACNDRCPNCRAETEPYDDQDLSNVVESAAPGEFIVMFSPDSAEDSPEYEPIGTFDNEHDALAFIQARHESVGQGEILQS